MLLVFERTLSASPAIVWPYLTMPDRMNMWSEGIVRSLSEGPLGHDDEEGARRSVTVPVLFGFHSVLAEEIVEAEPPTRFVYRVVSGGALRDHGW